MADTQKHTLFDNSPELPADIAQLISDLEERYEGIYGENLVQALVADEVFGRDGLILTSSFGVEAAILLKMVSKFQPDLAIVMLDTKMHFSETIAYKNGLKEQFNLTNIIELEPAQEDLEKEDQFDDLHVFDTRACCDIRKTRPLYRFLDEYPVQGWLTGRKRIDGGTRSNLRLFGAEKMSNGDWVVKINPLAFWTDKDIDAYFAQEKLPKHPLGAEYASIGCKPTQCTTSSSDRREGRWKEQDHKFCGMHKGITT